MPTKADVFEKVKTALIDALGVDDDQVTPEATMVGDLGAESIDFLDIVFRLEKGGRGGKTVTVIDRLPRQEKFLKELCKELKSKCGSGGTYSLEGEDGLIEIQGDKREAIKAIFAQKGIKFKGM